MDSVVLSCIASCGADKLEFSDAGCSEASSFSVNIVYAGSHIGRIYVRKENAKELAEWLIRNAEEIGLND